MTFYKKSSRRNLGVRSPDLLSTSQTKCLEAKVLSYTSGVHLKSYALISHGGLDFSASQPNLFELASAPMKTYQKLKKAKFQTKRHTNTRIGGSSSGTALSLRGFEEASCDAELQHNRPRSSKVRFEIDRPGFLEVYIDGLLWWTPRKGFSF